jgi:Domain of unknown function (DUF4190)
MISFDGGLISDPDGAVPVPILPSSIMTPLASRRRIPPVPTEQPGHLIAEEAAPKESPIENELPTYRAISNRAVFSVICGLLASFSFADVTFLFFAVLAIFLGILAHRAIKRNPDVLTGGRLANVGIALGLIFGLTVITYTGIQYVILRREAAKFAVEYAKVLQEKTFGDVLLYREPPDRRKEQTGEDKQKEYDAMKSRDRMMLDQRMAPLKNLHAALNEKGGRIRFVGVEGQGVDESLVGGVYYYAAVLYEIEGGGAQTGHDDHPHQYALALFKGRAKGRHYEWWVDDTRFPYQPASYKLQAKPVDDGHGHAPGAH